MTIHTRQELEKLSRVARREYSRALMSDTKWRKLFGALADGDTTIEQIVVKFIDVDETRRMRLPSTPALNCPLPYVDTFEFGPVELRSIEWLELPFEAVWPREDHLPPQRIAQDLSAVRAILAGLGQFPMEEGASGLRITGYLR